MLTQLAVADVLFFTWADDIKKKGMKGFNEDSLQKERHIYIYFFLVVAITIIHPQKESEWIQDCTLCI